MTDISESPLSLEQRGRRLAEAGQHVAAIEGWSTARDAYMAASDQTGELRCTFAIATAYGDLGDDMRAKAALLSVLPRLDEIVGYTQKMARSSCLMNLATFEDRLDEVPAALSHLDAALLGFKELAEESEGDDRLWADKLSADCRYNMVNLLWSRSIGSGPVLLKLLTEVRNQYRTVDAQLAATSGRALPMEAPEIRLRMAQCDYQEGMILNDQGEGASAEACVRKAIVQFDQLDAWAQANRCRLLLAQIQWSLPDADHSRAAVLQAITPYVELDRYRYDIPSGRSRAQWAATLALYKDWLMARAVELQDPELLAELIEYHLNLGIYQTLDPATTNPTKQRDADWTRKAFGLALPMMQTPPLRMISPRGRIAFGDDASVIATSIVALQTW